MPNVIKNPPTGTPEKFDLQALMTALENPDVTFKDIQPILDGGGSTYAEDAVQNANEYITKWNNSARSKEILTDLINKTQLPNNRAKKTLALTGRTSFARPTDVDSFKSTDYDIEEHLKRIVPTLRNASNYSGNKKALRALFNSRKDELKELGYRKPLFHKNRVELADRLISEDTDRTVDNIVKYRGLMQSLNPTNIQKNVWRKGVELKLPWRPTNSNDPTSEYTANAIGIVSRPNYGSPATVEGWTNDELREEYGGEGVPSGRNAPYIMGLPTGFQKSMTSITSGLSSTPRQLENTATHELSHLIDTPDKGTSYMDSIVTVVDKKEGLNYDNTRVKYLMKPTETNARIQVLRKHLYSSGIDVFNEPVNWSSIPKSVLEDASNNFGQGLQGGNSALNELREIYTDKVIEELLNTLP